MSDAHNELRRGKQVKRRAGRPLSVWEAYAKALDARGAQRGPLDQLILDQLVEKPLIKVGDPKFIQGRAGSAHVKSPSGKTKIAKPAGASALALLRIFVAQRAIDRVFGQTVADMREECIQAIVAKKPWGYRAAWFRGHVAIVFAVFAFLTASVLKRIVDIWKVV